MAPLDPTFIELPKLTELFERPSLEAWREAAEASLGERPLDRLDVRTHEGLTLGALFTEADSSHDPGYPGQAPHVRGRTPLGAGPSGWSVCQTVAHPDPDIAARWAAEDLERGADSVLLVFDNRVRTADDAMENASGDGLFITTSRDLDALVGSTDRTAAGVHLIAGGNAPAVSAAFVAAARRSGIDLRNLTGSIGFDPLGSLATDGVLTAGLAGSFDLLADLTSWTSRKAPGLRAIAVDTVGYHLAGASAAEELAWALATAVEYLRALAERGVEPAAACRQIIFRYAVGRDLFIEAAKLRAGRRLWSRAAGSCGADDEGSASMIHAVASPRGLTTRDPWVNMLRTTVGSFAAAVGGADIITVLPFDSAIGPPDELGRRMATNSQTILREESHLARVIDPGGGSWYVERLTADLAGIAWTRFQAIEAAGGMAAALLDGAVAEELDRLRADREHAIATRRDPVTGVSSFPNLAEAPLDRRPAPPPRPSPADSATEALARLFAATSDPAGDGTIMSAAIAAADAGAGIGRLAAALRGTRDRSRLDPFPTRRDGEIFENLRDASDAHLEAHGSRPRIFLANMGAGPEHRGRANFAVNFFEAGGIEAVTNDGFSTVAEAADAFAAAGTAMAVICSSDERYAEVVPELAPALDERGARTVLLVGRPGESETMWRATGVTGFIHAGCDQYRILVDLLREDGVLHV